MGNRFQSIVGIEDSSGNTTITVASTATVYTKSINISRMIDFCLRYQLGSSPSMKIEFEQGMEEPTTEGSSDSNWVVPDSASDIETNLTDTVYHLKAISGILPLPYFRLKITGDGSNGAGATFTGQLLSSCEG